MATKKNNTRRKEQHDLELNDARKTLEDASSQFIAYQKDATTHSANATTAMLNQTQLVLDISTKFKRGLFANEVNAFRRETSLDSASKWSQFKKIGQVASQLLPHASRLPSGWSSLSVIAAAVAHKTRPIAIEDLLNATREDARGNAMSLNAYSTQSEVRFIIASLGGRTPTQRVPTPPCGNAVIRIALDKVSDWTTINEQMSAVQNAIADAVQKFPFVELEAWSLNALAKQQIAMRQQKKVKTAA